MHLSQTAGRSFYWSAHNLYWGLHPLNQHIFELNSKLTAARVDLSEVTFTW